jgi:general secretion pathway protein B
MSYLLDALKQSQQADMSAEQYDLQSEQLKQQQALARYRRIAFILGGSLAAFVTITAGFTVGKWMQSSGSVEPSNVVSSQSNEQVTTQLETEALPVTQQAEVNEKPKPEQLPSNTATIEGQLVHVQTPTGIQQMLLTPTGQYIPMPSTGAANGIQQVYNQPQLLNTQNYNQLNQGQPNPPPQFTYNQGSVEQTQSTSSTSIDMSKYKVLGKPISGAARAEPKSDPVLDAVPTTLKNAFAQAVQDVDKNQDYEVTQASKSSSRVEPIELLPDGLQAMLPSIKYQAHIYSSSADKRWIKLNGRELHEGDSIGALMVKEITPEQSVIDFDGYEFSLKALQDWPE